MRRHGKRRRVAGFTMIESVLAILLLTIIVGALATVTSQWMRSWSWGIGRTQDVDLLAAAFDRIAADLTAAEVVSSNGANGSPEFEGADTAVRFVRTAFGPASGPGLEMVRIGETDGPTGRTINRSAAAFPASGSGSAAPAPPVVILRGFRIAFSYAAADGVWRDNWRGMPALPRLVRVRLGNGASVNLATVVAIRAELPARCAALRPPPECPQPDVAVLDTDRSENVR